MFPSYTWMGMAERARVVRKIAVASRRAKLARQFNPRTSIPKFKVEMGLASRTPNFQKFFQCDHNKIFFCFLPKFIITL